MGALEVTMVTRQPGRRMVGGGPRSVPHAQMRRHEFRFLAGGLMECRDDLVKLGICMRKSDNAVEFRPTTRDFSTCADGPALG